MLKQIFNVALFSILCSKCTVATDPTPRPSASMQDSKNDSLFLWEYLPELPYLRIEDRKYKIKEAWGEYTHVDRNNGHKPGRGHDFVMTFDEHTNDSINFNNYTKNLALGNRKIWFFLREQDYIKDTLILYYHETLNSKELRKFILVKKK